jgi:hypothetical protein
VNNPKQNRGRHRNNGRRSNPARQNFDSNGPGVRIRGNATQVYEKYIQLARDAQGSGDRVMSENMLQHAEHYYRILNDGSNDRPQRDNRADNSDSDQQADSADDSDEDGQDAASGNGNADGSGANGGNGSNGGGRGRGRRPNSGGGGNSNSRGRGRRGQRADDEGGGEESAAVEASGSENQELPLSAD